MDAEFINSFSMTPERYLYFCDHPVGAEARKNLRRWSVLNTALLVLALASALTDAVLKDWDMLLVSLVLAALVLYRLFFLRKRKNLRLYRQIRKAQTSGEWIRTTVFSDAVRIQDCNVQTVLQYDEIRDISQDEKHFYLWRDKDLVVRLPKDCFTLGSADDFPAFLREKTVPSAK